MGESGPPPPEGAANFIALVNNAPQESATVSIPPAELPGAANQAATTDSSELPQNDSPVLPARADELNPALPDNDQQATAPEPASADTANDDTSEPKNGGLLPATDEQKEPEQAQEVKKTKEIPLAERTRRNLAKLGNLYKARALPPNTEIPTSEPLFITVYGNPDAEGRVQSKEYQ